MAKTTLHNIFRTDRTQSEDGAWVTVNDLLGLKVRIRRLNSKPSLKAYEKALREAVGENAMKDLTKVDESVIERAIAYRIAYGVLVDWEGVKDEKGKQIKFDAKFAYDLLCDPEMADFRDFILQQADTRDNFRHKAVEEDEGNS